MTMKICVLSDEEEKDFDPTLFMDGFDWELVTMTNPVMSKLRVLGESKKYNIYLNLCEGYEDDDPNPYRYDGLEVVQALETLRYPFTGADSKFFCQSRNEMQRAAHSHGINFVKGYQVNSFEEIEMLASDMCFPLIVKHPNSYGSIGLTKDSRVDTPEQLHIQVHRICSKFGAARVEEFIIGQEFNVLVVDNPDDVTDPLVYLPIELVFPQGEEFWHADVKWNANVPVYCKRVSNPDLTLRLQEMACRMYLAIGGIGYARCDIRLNENDQLFLLEINPNPGIMFGRNHYSSADCIIMNDTEGYTGFLTHIFRAALVRNG